VHLFSNSNGFFYFIWLKTGIDTALNITNYKFGITQTEVVMKTQSILIQYFKVAARCFANLLSVRAGLYVKQTDLPKQ
jgi:hypothetical protein